MEPIFHTKLGQVHSLRSQAILKLDFLLPHEVIEETLIFSASARVAVRATFEEQFLFRARRGDSVETSPRSNRYAISLIRNTAGVRFPTSPLEVSAFEGNNLYSSKTNESEGNS